MFCSKFGVASPYPLQEDILCSYAAYLAKEGLKYPTMKAYLSGIRFLQIQQSLGNPFASCDMARLESVLSGINRIEAWAGHSPRSRLPITTGIMHHLRAVWLADP